MQQLIRERITIEALESLTEDLNELNCLMNSVIADIRSARLSIAELRSARENGENND